jgi:hypothetical protein
MADDTTRRNKWVGALESIFPHASSEATTSDTAQSTKQSFSNISLNDSHHFVGGTHQQSQIKLPGYWTHQRRYVPHDHRHLQVPILTISIATSFVSRPRQPNLTTRAQRTRSSEAKAKPRMTPSLYPLSGLGCDASRKEASRKRA